MLVDDKARLETLQTTAPFYGHNHKHKKEVRLQMNKPLMTQKYREKFLRDPFTYLLQSCYWNRSVAKSQADKSSRRKNMKFMLYQNYYRVVSELKRFITCKDVNLLWY